LEFSEYTLALGTLTSGKPYDVFAYNNSGALALEVLVWTDDTTRATAITIQDGRYCKSGAKDRLYLGTFYTTSTTTTEDSTNNRYVWNQYNQVEKFVTGGSTASHTYTTASYREWNAGTSVTRAQWVNGNPVTIPCLDIVYATGTAGIGNMRCGLDSTTTNAIDDGIWVYCGSVTEGVHAIPGVAVAAAGKHFLTMQETGLTGQTLYNFTIRGLLPC
jgi:hypothetical protein